MESKKAPQPQSKASYPTILGAAFFALFNLILLSILSWILLEIWFSVKIILNNEAVDSIIQEILNANHIIMKSHQSQFIQTILSTFHTMNNYIYETWSSHIDQNILRTFLNVTEITLLRSCLFIQFTPFISVILNENFKAPEKVHLYFID